ncbi:hypothetical protein QMZ20_14295, partial [Serratia bockelmannii]|nr:hypothetical protein [Serratia bockelmannii]
NLILSFSNDTFAIYPTLCSDFRSGCDDTAPIQHNKNNAGGNTNDCLPGRTRRSVDGGLRQKMP